MNIATEIDRAKLAKVAAEAIAQVENSSRTDSKRWVRAIAKAVVEIENNPFIEWLPDNNSVLILSQSSGTVYQSNGTCQCRAFEEGYPCYHRALARLIQRYLETQ